METNPQDALTCKDNQAKPYDPLEKIPMKPSPTLRKANEDEPTEQLQPRQSNFDLKLKDPVFVCYKVNLTCTYFGRDA
ncbi:unnamed protein product [Arabis nemorensis]|uniref:Uncharacterized protein n=1 Tax=Arabis nemorensis TaxID=586526 RepID=A0A565AXW4_9BRAS|nr:unnamed protein product [Arabis nemorensis]